MSYIGIIFKVWFLQDSVLFRVRFGSVQQYNFIQQCSKHSISLVVIFIFSIGQYDESPLTSQHRKQHYFNSSGINLPVIPEKLVYGDWTSTPNNSNIYKKKVLICLPAIWNLLQTYIVHQPGFSKYFKCTNTY